MGTRSAIGYLQPSGSVRAVYCHWDGYPSHQLPILETHYNTTAKVKALVKPGSMSSLRTDQTWESDYQRDENGKADFEAPKTNRREPQPLYHAERGDGMKAITSGQPLVTWFKEHDCEHLYVFDGSRWIHYAAEFPG